MRKKELVRKCSGASNTEILAQCWRLPYSSRVIFLGGSRKTGLNKIKNTREKVPKYRRIRCDEES